MPRNTRTWVRSALVLYGYIMGFYLSMWIRVGDMPVKFDTGKFDCCLIFFFFFYILHDVYNIGRIIMSSWGSLPTVIWYTYPAPYCAKNVNKTKTWRNYEWHSNQYRVLSRQSLRFKWHIQPIVWELNFTIWGIQTNWGHARVGSGQYSSTDTNPYLMPSHRVCMILRHSNASKLPTHVLHLEWLPFYGHTVDWVS